MYECWRKIYEWQWTCALTLYRETLNKINEILNFFHLNEFMYFLSESRSYLVGP